MSDRDKYDEWAAKYCEAVGHVRRNELASFLRTHFAPLERDAVTLMEFRHSLSTKRHVEGGRCAFAGAVLDEMFFESGEAASRIKALSQRGEGGG